METFDGLEQFHPIELSIVQVSIPHDRDADRAEDDADRERCNRHSQLGFYELPIFWSGLSPCFIPVQCLSVRAVDGILERSEHQPKNSENENCPTDYSAPPLLHAPPPLPT